MIELNNMELANISGAKKLSANAEYWHNVRYNQDKALLKIILAGQEGFLKLMDTDSKKDQYIKLLQSLTN